MSTSLADADTSADVISISNLALSAVVGLDQWARTETVQPLSLSLDFLLPPSALLLATAADNPHFSVRPWDIVRAVNAAVADAGPAGFSSPKTFLTTVARAVANAPSAPVCEEVRLKLDMRRALGALRAEEGIVVHAILGPASAPSTPDPSIPPASGAITGLTLVRCSWAARGILLATTLGISDHERSMRQNIALDLTFFETPGSGADQEVPYPLFVERVVQLVEMSAFRSLERLVHEAARVAALGSPLLDRVTVRARRLKILNEADFTAVQMTRTRASFVDASGS